MNYSDEQKNRIAAGARDFFTKHANPEGTICDLENFQASMAKMHALVQPSPLPSDEELRRISIEDGDPDCRNWTVDLVSARALYASALRLASRTVVKHEDGCHKSECPACVLLAWAVELESR